MTPCTFRGRRLSLLPPQVQTIQHSATSKVLAQRSVIQDGCLRWCVGSSSLTLHPRSRYECIEGDTEQAVIWRCQGTTCTRSDCNFQRPADSSCRPSPPEALWIAVFHADLPQRPYGGSEMDLLRDYRSGRPTFRPNQVPDVQHRPPRRPGHRARSFRQHTPTEPDGRRTPAYAGRV